MEREGLTVALLIRETLEVWYSQFPVDVPREADFGNGYIVGSFAQQLLEAHTFQIPDKIRQQIPNIVNLGENGRKLLLCIARSHELNRITNRLFAQRTLPLGSPQVINMTRMLVHELIELDDDLATVLSNVVERLTE
jgi:hypothetical protein